MNNKATDVSKKVRASLTLGEEIYIAEGSTSQEAKQKACQSALLQTSYYFTQPPPLLLNPDQHVVGKT